MQTSTSACIYLLTNYAENELFLAARRHLISWLAVPSHRSPSIIIVRRECTQMVPGTIAFSMPSDRINGAIVDDVRALMATN